MSKKSVLLATLLAGANMFSGCGKTSPDESSSTKDQKSNITQVLNVPIFVNEMPRAMILPNPKGGYVQLLYPVQEGGKVLEDKDQYEKRIKWLNEKYPENLTKAVSLAGCQWKDRKKPPESPFVSIFDKKEYIYQHISWMKGFYRPGNKFKVNYSPEKDPIVLWWVAQTEFHKLFSSKGKVASSAFKQKQY